MMNFDFIVNICDLKQGIKNFKAEGYEVKRARSSNGRRLNFFDIIEDSRIVGTLCADRRGGIVPRGQAVAIMKSTPKIKVDYPEVDKAFHFGYRYSFKTQQLSISPYVMPTIS